LRTREALGELMSRRLADLRLAVMMLDGLELKGRMMNNVLRNYN
jgi:putative transposase